MTTGDTHVKAAEDVLAEALMYRRREVADTAGYLREAEKVDDGELHEMVDRVGRAHSLVMLLDAVVADETKRQGSIYNKRGLLGGTDG